ncbi:hypothetical protein DRO54_07135 [Candidatus Bathyarchaeota archaeon]|nr:MAG: hypothetical protein DRO54_07135 [Candidatus Bathyarchaeota archaeon]
MIKHLEEFDKYLAITAYKGVKITNVENFIQNVRKNVEDAIIQFFDAKFIAGWEHLYFAVLNALAAFENNFNISRNLAVEILLYAAAERQIRNAVELIGIKEGTRNVAIVVLAESEEKVVASLDKLSAFIQAVEDESLLEIDDEKFKALRRLFNVSDLELEAKLEKEGLEKEALKDLIIERVALLVTRR